jgi:hypothetical protein
VPSTSLTDYQVLSDSNFTLNGIPTQDESTEKVLKLAIVIPVVGQEFEDVSFRVRSRIDAPAGAVSIDDPHAAPASLVRPP